MPLSNKADTLHLAVAGSGNPYAHLTPERLDLLRLLFERNETQTAEEAGLTLAELDQELQSLQAASLLHGEVGRRLPKFFLATEADMPRLDSIARDLGTILAGSLQERWSAIASRFATLFGENARSFNEYGFFLVGDLILDVGLLDGLAAETDLMPPAPARPGPDEPDARFYVWMIEGDRSQLGQYGQRVTALPWSGWELRTFGDYWIGSTSNHNRESLEHDARRFAPECKTVHQLAKKLAVPFYNSDTAAAWWTFARDEARILAVLLDERKLELQELYRSLPASGMDGTSFGEFFCWYVHVIYAHAIDVLVESGLFNMPPYRFTAAIWPAGDESAF